MCVAAFLLIGLADSTADPYYQRAFSGWYNVPGDFRGDYFSGAAPYGDLYLYGPSYDYPQQARLQPLVDNPNSLAVAWRPDPPLEASEEIVRPALDAEAPLPTPVTLKAVPAVPQEHYDTYGPKASAGSVPEIVPPSHPEPHAPVQPNPAYVDDHSDNDLHGHYDLANEVLGEADLYAENRPEASSQIVSNQFHVQDELGNVRYGYANPNSAKEETRDSHGAVVGRYSYIDGTGLPKHVSYVADDFGFRVTSSNIF